jgi:hypothetical protein
MKVKSMTKLIASLLVILSLTIIHNSIKRGLPLGPTFFLDILLYTDSNRSMTSFEDEATLELNQNLCSHEVDKPLIRDCITASPAPATPSPFDDKPLSKSENGHNGHRSGMNDYEGGLNSSKGVERHIGTRSGVVADEGLKGAVSK